MDGWMDSVWTTSLKNITVGWFRLVATIIMNILSLHALVVFDRDSQGGREGRCAERGRCWPVTQSELWFSAGRHESCGQTQVAPCSSCVSGCAAPPPRASYGGCVHAGHMIADWTDAWVRDKQLSGDSHAQSTSQVQESLCQIINRIAKEAQSALCFCMILN